MKKTLCSILAGIGLTISTALTSFANPEEVIILSPEEFKDFKKERTGISGPHITLSDYTTQDDCYSELIQELQKKTFERGYNLIVVRDIQEPYAMAGAGGGAGPSFGYNIEWRRMRYSIIANLYSYNKEKPKETKETISEKDKSKDYQTHEIRLINRPFGIRLGDLLEGNKELLSKLDSTIDPLEKKEIIDQLDKRGLKIVIEE